MMRVPSVYIGLILFTISSCKTINEEPTSTDHPRFVSIEPSHSNITFSNNLSYSEEFNTYTYRNFYNGAGVGIGDVNGDGHVDVFFCGNMVSNRLYLNKGNFVFNDVSDEAGVATDNVWSTGVSLADVNADGLLDIFVCKSGKPGGERRHNELLINQGNNEDGIPTFIDKSHDYGVADVGLSIHAAFFDFDKDGDLDMYLLA